VIKGILTVIASWLMSLGIYYELPIAYGVYWTVGVIVSILTLGTVLLIPSTAITEDVRTRTNGNLFSVKRVIHSLLITPAFLYAVVASNSWSTLGLYVLILVCGVTFFFHVLKNPKLEIRGDKRL
jgi:hypothetical protein